MSSMAGSSGATFLETDYTVAVAALVTAVAATPLCVVLLDYSLKRAYTAFHQQEMLQQSIPLAATEVEPQATELVASPILYDRPASPSPLAAAPQDRLQRSVRDPQFREQNNILVQSHSSGKYVSSRI